MAFVFHVDAAYGGYFTLAGNLGAETRAAFDAMAQADSLVIDPHKHGLQPYGCGCVLFRDPAVGRFYKHDSPYTYFTSKELGTIHLGEISLGRSRAQGQRQWRCGRRSGCCPTNRVASLREDSSAGARRHWRCTRSSRQTRTSCCRLRRRSWTFWSGR